MTAALPRSRRPAAAVALRAALAGVLLLAPAARGHALTVGEPSGSPTANLALAMCRATPERPTASYRDRLEAGLRLAEAAVAADPRDAKAHFALFCNLAKLTHIRGVGVHSLFAVSRLRQAIDRTLELAPDYVDALTAKGAFVLHLPRVLGGDPAEAERLLRRALELDPAHPAARRFHAEALAALGVRASPPP